MRNHSKQRQKGISPTDQALSPADASLIVSADGLIYPLFGDSLLLSGSGAAKLDSNLAAEIKKKTLKQYNVCTRGKLNADYKKHDTLSCTDLQDDEDGIASTQLPHIAIHAGYHIRHCLADRDENAQQLLCTGSAPHPH